MKYNRTFILAVAATAQAQGDTAAAELFNKLFDVAYPVPGAAPKSRYDLIDELRGKVGQAVYLSDIEATVNAVGIPGALGVSAVTWIKKFREKSGYGLMVAKNTYDFVRDNRSILEDDSF